VLYFVNSFAFYFTTVNKSKDSPVDAAKKKAELEKRLQDVSGQLSGTKSSKSSKKNAGKLVISVSIQVGSVSNLYGLLIKTLSWLNFSAHKTSNKGVVGQK